MQPGSRVLEVLWMEQNRLARSLYNVEMSYPQNYRYAKSHEWLNLDGETATVGITDYAQESLGDIVFVELPKVGQQLEAGATFGSVESV